MRRKVELEYKKNLSRTNEEYKNEMNRLLKAERDKSSKCEKRYEACLEDYIQQNLVIVLNLSIRLHKPRSILRINSAEWCKCN
jgi:hypothetical protein